MRTTRGTSRSLPAWRQVLARRSPGELSQAGYAVAGLSRTAAKVSDLAQEIGHSGSLYRDYACNLGNADQVAHTFKEIEIAHGAPSVLIYNAMQLVAKPFAELTPEDFEQSWRSTCFG